MNTQPPVLDEPLATDLVLKVYLVGLVDFEAAQALQRRLVYEVAGQRSAAALLLCEHPPLITVGRQGSWRHLLEVEAIQARRWPVRWVNRGGGCLLHLPGQLAIYPILALDQLGLGLQAYLDRLQQVLYALLEDFSIRAQIGLGAASIGVNGRSIAHVGVAVREWVAYYGAVLNVNPDLEALRQIRIGGPALAAMTSLERERHGPLHPALVRERLLEHFTACFGFSQTALFFDHPLLRRKVRADALAPRS
jgi:lipoyl(octanoyl) transferase